MMDMKDICIQLAHLVDTEAKLVPMYLPNLNKLNKYYIKDLIKKNQIKYIIKW